MYSDFSYNSPWFHNNPALPGPDNNNVRTYTSVSDYTQSFGGRQAQIAIMGPNIAQNISKFDYTKDAPRVQGAMAKAGLSRKTKLGDFKLTAAIWSPAPWLKISSGSTYGSSSGIMPTQGTPWPFIWGGNFAGGKLDVSNTPKAEFFDGTQNTSALTQFARSTAAYIKGLQDLNGISFYSISIQNELNFEVFYNSCNYPLSSQYITALKAVRAEFDKYSDLKNIKIMGPEDLLGGDAYGMWQFGGGSTAVHKNLQYLTEIAKDTVATDAIDYYCIHGYANNGVSSAGSNPTVWDWWANGWVASPAGGIPPNVKGFMAYNKKSWMTETSGEETPWLSPSTGFPNNGAFSVALKIHQALTTGEQSAWVYWQFAEGGNVSTFNLTDATQLGTAAKYNAFKHYSRFIRPNAVRLNTGIANGSNISVSSYIHDANKSLTVVIVNSNSTPQTITVNVPSLPFSISSFDVFTSSNNNYWKNSMLNVSQNKVTLTVPGYGVSTLNGVEILSTGLTNQAYDTWLNVYPNPASKSIHIETGKPMKLITLYSIAGSVVHSEEMKGTTSHTLNTEKIIPGLYFVKIMDANGAMQVKLLHLIH